MNNNTQSRSTVRTLSRTGLLSLALVGACASLISCSSGVPRYDGPMSEVSAVKGYSNPINITYWGSRNTNVHSVGGVPQGQLRKNRHGFIVPPGKWQVNGSVDWDDASIVSALAGGKKRGFEPRTVPFNAKAGHRYRLMAKNQNVKAWGLGGERMVWIEDIETGEVAGGTRPPKSSSP